MLHTEHHLYIQSICKPCTWRFKCNVACVECMCRYIQFYMCNHAGITITWSAPWASRKSTRYQRSSATRRWASWVLGPRRLPKTKSRPWRTIYVYMRCPYDCGVWIRATHYICTYGMHTRWLYITICTMYIYIYIYMNIYIYIYIWGYSNRFQVCVYVMYIVCMTWFHVRVRIIVSSDCFQVCVRMWFVYMWFDSRVVYLARVVRVNTPIYVFVNYTTYAEDTSLAFMDAINAAKRCHLYRRTSSTASPSGKDIEDQRVYVWMGVYVFTDQMSRCVRPWYETQCCTIV